MKATFMKPYLGLLFFLVACGPSAEDTGPGGVSIEDARALDAAAEKLDTGAQLPDLQNQPVVNKATIADQKLDQAEK
jgi:hypothetical protein